MTIVNHGGPGDRAASTRNRSTRNASIDNAQPETSRTDAEMADTDTLQSARLILIHGFSRWTSCNRESPWHALPRCTTIRASPAKRGTAHGSHDL